MTSFFGTVKFFSDSVWSLLGILLVSGTPGGSTGKLSAGVSTGKYSSGASTCESSTGFACAVLPSESLD